MLFLKISALDIVIGCVIAVASMLAAMAIAHTLAASFVV
jgi:hypothetical protein